MHIAANNCNIEAMRIMAEDDEKLLDLENNFGDTPLELLTDKLRKVRRMKNALDNVDPEVVRKYIKDFTCPPFVLDATRKRPTFIRRDSEDTLGGSEKNGK